jgi:hypothetical protein
MTHPMARDNFEHLVGGDMLTTTIGDFKLRAARIIEAEQAKANPDNYLIAFACDAIRFAREFGGFYHDTLDTLAAKYAERLQKRKPDAS